MNPFLRAWQHRVEAAPNAVALEFAAGSLTRMELWRMADDVARRLKDRGIQPGDRVSLCLDRSQEWIAAALGVWMSGAAWVPLLPAAPLSRNRMIESIAAPGIQILRGAALEYRLPTLARADESHLQAADEAYVIFTSGSTGRPKGVSVGHAGLVGMLNAQIESFRLDDRCRALWMLSPAFDASVSDWGTALLAGATLIIAEDSADVLELLVAKRVTHADLPPVILPAAKTIPPDLRTVVIGGEVADPDAVRRWAEQVRLVNVYGPTEATVCTSQVVCDAHWTRPRIGAPLPQVIYQVRDESGAELSGDGTGELWIGGSQVARGYLGEPELTRERFVSREGMRFFRTGDRVRRIGSGYEYRGRMDRQVKIAGQLVAPEEIEAVLVELPGVRRAAVVCHSSTGRPRLEGHVQVSDHLEPREILAYLKGRLPAWMLPSKVQLHAQLPLTASGKVDWRQLQTCRPEVSNLAPRTAVASTDRLETLQSVFRAVTGGDKGPLWSRGLRENGGDSLDAWQMSTELLRSGIAISPEMLLDAPSLACLLEPGDRDSAVLDAETLRRDARNLLTAARPPADLSGGIPRELDGRVLLTGATGLFGSHLLRELVGSGRRVTCLVRSADAGQLAERLDILRGGVAEDWRAMISAVPGDLARPRLGLSEEDWAALAAQTSDIVHSGARVELTASYAELRRVNVEAVAELVHLASEGRAKRIHHISTLSVFVSSEPRPQFAREADNRHGALRFLGGYAQSKFAAEEVLRCSDLAAQHIYRLGLLLDESGAHTPRVLRQALGFRPGCAASKQLAFDVTPAGWAARVVIRMMVEPGSVPGARHIAGRRRVTAAQLLEWSAVIHSSMPDSGDLEIDILFDQPALRPLSLYQASGIVFEQSFRERFPDLVDGEPAAESVVRAHLAALAATRTVT